MISHFGHEVVVVEEEEADHGDDEQSSSSGLNRDTIQKKEKLRFFFRKHQRLTE